MAPIFYYIIRPLIILCVIGLCIWAIVVGAQFWADVVGQPSLEPINVTNSSTHLVNVVVFVPNRLQPNQEYKFEIEMYPSSPIIQTVTTSVALLENEDFVSATETKVPVKPGTSKENPIVTKISVHTRNLRFPPSSVTFTPQISINDQAITEVQPFTVVVDAWSGKTFATLKILVGLIGFLLSLRGLWPW